MANRWAYAISMRRGDVTRVEEFCAQPQVLDARDRVESWLASQPRENRVRACLDRAASDALAQQLSRADCGDVWFLTSDGYIVLGPFVTQGGALDMTTWLLRGGGNLLVDETPLTTRWMLSVLALAVAKRGYVDALEMLLSSSIFREGLTDEEYQSLLDCIARAWVASKVSFECANMANVLLAHGCAIESLHGAGDLGSDDVNRVLMEHSAYLYGVSDTSSSTWPGSVHPAYLRSVVEAGADPRMFAWHHILSSGTASAAHMLMSDWYLDVDARLPAERDCTPLVFAVVSKDVSIVTVVLDSGADLTLTDTIGWTALTIATIFGIEPVMELLLTRGADPNHVDHQGKSILNHASERPLRGSRMIDLLQQYGAQ